MEEEDMKRVMKEAFKEVNTPEERKEVLKEAAKEYFEESLGKFGWFSIKTIGAALVLGIVILAGKLHGL